MKENTPFLSVVCTLYNRAGSIGKTLGSILPFLREEDEFILVDDGSTDGGGEIVKSAFEGRPNCFYYHQNNKGLTVAFNRCLDIARGEFIVNIDSDDYFTDTGLNTIRRVLVERNPDMLHYGWLEIDADGIVSEHPNFPEECHFVSREEMLSSKVFQSRAGSVINGYVRKAIRRSIIGELRLEPPDRGGDNPFIAQVFTRCTSLSAIRDLCYVYVITANSVSRSNNNVAYNKADLERWLRTIPFFLSFGRKDEYPLVEAAKIFYSYRDYCLAAVTEDSFEPLFAKNAARTICENQRMILQKRSCKGSFMDRLFLRFPKLAVSLVRRFYRKRGDANSSGKYSF